MGVWAWRVDLFFPYTHGVNEQQYWCDSLPSWHDSICNQVLILSCFTVSIRWYNENLVFWPPSWAKKGDLGPGNCCTIFQNCRHDILVARIFIVNHETVNLTLLFVTKGNFWCKIDILTPVLGQKGVFFPYTPAMRIWPCCYGFLRPVYVIIYNPTLNLLIYARFLLDFCSK